MKILEESSVFRLAVLCIGSIGFAAPGFGAPVYGVSAGNSLILFDSAMPGMANTVGAISGLQAGENILGIDFRPATGELFALGDNRLYMIDKMTGAATQVGSDGAFMLTGTSFGFDFNPTVDRIRLTSNTGQDLRLNPINGGLAATDGDLAFAAGDANEGDAPNVIGSAYTNSFAGATTTTLYNIEVGNGVLVTQMPPNAGTLNTVGALGFPVGTTGGFDISGLDGSAFFAGGNSLYSINLASGAASLVGAIGSTSGGITSIAIDGAPIPEPQTYLLISAGLAGLMWMRRRKAA